MKLSILQTAPAWRLAEESIAEADRLLAEIGETDLIALPEMWPTGFDAHPGEASRHGAELAVAWMERTARERDCAVVGSVAWLERPGRERDCAEAGGVDGDERPARERDCAEAGSVDGSERLARERDRAEAGSVDGDEQDKGCWRNRCLFVTPEGIAAHYDKAHLFTPAGEHLSFCPGGASPVVCWRGFRFKMQTCFDLRFPEGARNRADAPYDVLLYGASWPVQRRAAWDTLLRARAIENQAYCLGVNRTGNDPNCQYNGGSALVAPNGELLTPLSPKASPLLAPNASPLLASNGNVATPLDPRPQAATFEIDPETLARARRRFTTLLPAEEGIFDN